MQLVANGIIAGSRKLGVSALDTFAYADGTLLGDTPNWDICQGQMIIASGRAKAYADSLVSILRYVGRVFNPEAVAECTIGATGGNAGGVAVRCQAGSPRCYLAYCSASNIYMGYMDAFGNGQGWQAWSPGVGVGGKLRMWATGLGSATRLNVQAFHVGAPDWADAWVNYDFGLYYDGGSPGLSGWSATSQTEIEEWRGYEL